MTRQEIIDLCLTFAGAYEDYPFDNVIDENACTAIRHKQNKKTFAFIMRHNGELYLNLERVFSKLINSPKCATIRHKGVEIWDTVRI